MDLISLIVTLIIMSLFSIGIMFALIIMSQEKDIEELEYEKEAEIQCIREYQLKEAKKKQARKEFINKVKNKIKK